MAWLPMYSKPGTYQSSTKERVMGARGIGPRMRYVAKSKQSDPMKALPITSHSPVFCIDNGSILGHLE